MVSVMVSATGIVWLVSSQLLKQLSARRTDAFLQRERVEQRITVVKSQKRVNTISNKPCRSFRADEREATR
jgi:hypothetical protein